RGESMAETLDTENGLARLTGREARTQSIATRFTPAEEQVLLRRAEASGQNLREWAREVLLREANPETTDSGIEMLLTEVVGLQLFLAHVLGPIACGETITASQYEELLRQVRANKRRAAREAMAKRESLEEE
ncbi:MAG: hypothetical protein ACRD3N_10860, partial [Terracidiphilus sp.]